MAQSQRSLRVNKSTFLNGRSCATRGWLTRHRPIPPTTGDRARMEEGLQVGRRAREQFPNGALVDEKNVDAAAARTRELMADPRVSSLFEATFLVESYVARADILVRDARGWKLIEVKSGLTPNDDYLEDVAYTLMVAQRADVAITGAALWLLSRDYRLGDGDQDLFVECDVTQEVVPIAALPETPPEPQLIFPCRQCAYFGGACFSTDKDGHIFELPRLSKSLFTTLYRQKITKIVEIPKSVTLSSAQQRVRQATITQRPIVSKRELVRLLKGVQWPAYYLDFETVKSAIPLFPGVAPHEQVVTQYSLHRCNSPGDVQEHSEYLADPTCDCRRQLAEQLLADLSDCGSIIVYSSFEKTTLANLGRRFPDLSVPLERCIERLFDLEVAFKNYYYHPAFRGRTSIKVTLPALVDLTYDRLKIAGGDAAVAEYARMVRGDVTEAEAATIRQALLDYCKQDTLAMVLLHERLLQSIV
jgi:hypothetical protein